MITLAVLSFWVWDTHVMPPAYRRPEFELKQVQTLSDGQTQVKLWVERGLGDRTPSEAALRYFYSTLVNKTPMESLDPTLGVLEIEKKYLDGPPVPPSGDTSLNILVADIPPYRRKDGKLKSFDGFINAFDQVTDADAVVYKPYSQHSNEHNILYINATKDLASDYMRGVATHELGHLMTYGREGEEAQDAWFHEFIGEAAMQMSGFFTDTHWVEDYRANTATLPIAAAPYAEHLGALSMFAEYLLTHFPAENFRKMLTFNGPSFDRVQVVYGKDWNTLFAGYARWLYEQTPPTRFVVADWKFFVAEHKPEKTFDLVATGIAYFHDAVDTSQLAITHVPSGCTSSTNVLRSERVVSKGAPAYALWVESTPPCAAARDEQSYKTEMFTLEAKN